MSEVKKKTLGLAIGSLICGLFFLIPFLGMLLGLIAIVLGIIALVKISQNKDTFKGQGLAISGIILGAISILIIPVVGILAAIAIPNFVKARNNAIEAQAIASLQTVSAASQIYYAENGRYPDFITDLLGLQSYGLRDFVSQEEYLFEVIDTDNSFTFLMTAVPKSTAFSFKSFCLTEDGRVRVDNNGEDIPDYDSCRALPAY